MSENLECPPPPLDTIGAAVYWLMVGAQQPMRSVDVVCRIRGQSMMWSRDDILEACNRVLRFPDEPQEQPCQPNH